MRLFRPLLPAAVAIALAACATPNPALPESRHSANELLSGALLFGETVPAAPLDERALAVSPAMASFAHAHTQHSRLASKKLPALLDAMRDAGYLDLDYDHAATLAAPVVFDEKRGNCLSYTMMFVALARSVGLDAKFQLVDIPPVWNANNDLVAVDQHVNALVPKVRLDMRTTRDVVVDFNLADFQGNYPHHLISDDEVLARYYSNLAVQAMGDQDARLAFAYLKRALLADPGLATAWTNLGALYSRSGQLTAAAAAYQRTLLLDPGNPSALNNLASYYRRQRQIELAAQYEKRSRYYRDKNPYYHYQTSLAALHSGELKSAETHLAKALRLNAEEHQFHFLSAQISALNHDYAGSLRSLTRARDLASSAATKRRYSSKIERLQAHSG